MARTATVFARVEPATKCEAEEVLQKLGIPMSNAVDMFLRQVIIHNGLPFHVSTQPSSASFPSADHLSRTELIAELHAGWASAQHTPTIPLDLSNQQVDELLASLPTATERQ